MKTKQILATLALSALIPALASAATTPKYSAANIFSASSTVDLIPTTSGSGNVYGIKCIFPSTASGASVRITTTVDGAASTNFVIDPTNLERESSGAGQFTSGWLIFNIPFSSSIHIQMDNNVLGTASINCWATWVKN
ncbi:MAG TPA: hypothetical protein VH988_13115 [Thermoanaerobaculia bacterium]|jgi:hypothetical protein|nr:hypothetical protein [Thermoanaerobaculia bacterium]